MKKVIVKQKRHRRTKKEMEEFREKQKHMTGDCISKPKKSSEKPNLEVLDYVFDVKTKELEDAPKLVEGWVNVYKGTHGEYWLGSDIHYTVEEAKDIVGKHHNATQMKISFKEF